MILQVLGAYQQQGRARQHQYDAETARFEALRLEEHAQAEAQKLQAEVAAASRADLQEKHDITLYEEALIRLQHDKLLFAAQVSNTRPSQSHVRWHWDSGQPQSSHAAIRTHS